MVRTIAKLSIGFALAALVVCIAFIALLAIFQRSLIYPVPAVDASVPSGFDRITYQTEDGLTLSAGHLSAAEGMPTLLFFHGNGVGWQTTFHTTELLAAQGYGVLAAEYRGYSGNPGSPHEQGLYTDGRAALAWLETQGHSRQDIILVGNSLGSGVAVELARNMEARALILIAPFKSMTATANNAYPWAPADFLLQDRFDNIAKIGQVRVPILIVHGANDELIPLPHAEELARANAGTSMIVLPGYGHNMSGEKESQLPQLRFLEGLLN